MNMCAWRFLGCSPAYSLYINAWIENVPLAFCNSKSPHPRKRRSSDSSDITSPSACSCCTIL